MQMNCIMKSKVNVVNNGRYNRKTKRSKKK